MFFRRFDAVAGIVDDGAGAGRQAGCDLAYSLGCIMTRQARVATARGGHRLVQDAAEDRISAAFRRSLEWQRIQ